MIRNLLFLDSHALDRPRINFYLSEENLPDRSPRALYLKCKDNHALQIHYANQYTKLAASLRHVSDAFYAAFKDSSF